MGEEKDNFTFADDIKDLFELLKEGASYILHIYLFFISKSVPLEFVEKLFENHKEKSTYDYSKDGKTYLYRLSNSIYNLEKHLVAKGLHYLYNTVPLPFVKSLYENFCVNNELDCADVKLQKCKKALKNSNKNSSKKKGRDKYDQQEIADETCESPVPMCFRHIINDEDEALQYILREGFQNNSNDPDHDTELPSSVTASAIVNSYSTHIPIIPENVKNSLDLATSTHNIESHNALLPPLPIMSPPKFKPIAIPSTNYFPESSPFLNPFDEQKLNKSFANPFQIPNSSLPDFSLPPSFSLPEFKPFTNSSVNSWPSLKPFANPFTHSLNGSELYKHEHSSLPDSSIFLSSTAMTSPSVVISLPNPFKFNLLASMHSMSPSNSDSVFLKSLPDSSAVSKPGVTSTLNGNYSMPNSISSIHSAVTPTAAIIKPVFNPVEVPSKFSIISSTAPSTSFSTLPLPTLKILSEPPVISVPDFKPIPNSFESLYSIPMPTSKDNMLSSISEMRALKSVIDSSALSKHKKISLNNDGPLPTSSLKIPSVVSPITDLFKPLPNPFEISTKLHSVSSPPSTFSILKPLPNPPVISLPNFKSLPALDPTPHTFNLPNIFASNTSTEKMPSSKLEFPVLNTVPDYPAVYEHQTLSSSSTLPEEVPSKNALLKPLSNSFNIPTFSNVSLLKLPSVVPITNAQLKPLANPFEIPKYPSVSLPILQPLVDTFKLPDTFSSLEANPFKISYPISVATSMNTRSSSNIDKVSKNGQISPLNNSVSSLSTISTMATTSEFPSTLPSLPFSLPGLSSLPNLPIISLPAFNPLPNPFNSHNPVSSPTSTDTVLPSSNNSPVSELVPFAAVNPELRVRTSSVFKPLPKMFELPNSISISTKTDTDSSTDNNLSVQKSKSDSFEVSNYKRKTPLNENGSSTNPIAPNQFDRHIDIPHPFLVPSSKSLPPLPFPALKTSSDVPAISLFAFEPLPNPFNLPNLFNMPTSMDTMSSLTNDLTLPKSAVSIHKHTPHLNNGVSSPNSISKMQYSVTTTTAISKPLSALFQTPTEFPRISLSNNDFDEFAAVVPSSTSILNSTSLTPSPISLPSMPFSLPTLTPLPDPPLISVPDFKALPNLFDSPKSISMTTMTKTFQSSSPDPKTISLATSKPDHSVITPLPNLFQLPNPISLPNLIDNVSSINSNLSVPKPKSNSFEVSNYEQKTHLDKGVFLTSPITPKLIVDVPHSSLIPSFKPSSPLLGLKTLNNFPVISVPSFKPPPNPFKSPDSFSIPTATNDLPSSSNDLSLPKVSPDFFSVSLNKHTSPLNKSVLLLNSTSNIPSIANSTTSSFKPPSHLEQAPTELPRISSAQSSSHFPTLPVLASKPSDSPVISFPTFEPLSSLFKIPHTVSMPTSKDTLSSSYSDVPVISEVSSFEKKLSDSAMTTLKPTTSSILPSAPLTPSPISAPVVPFSFPNLTTLPDSPVISLPTLKSLPNIFDKPYTISIYTSTNISSSSGSNVPVPESISHTASKPNSTLPGLKPLSNLFELPNPISISTITDNRSNPFRISADTPQSSYMSSSKPLSLLTLPVVKTSPDNPVNSLPPFKSVTPVFNLPYSFSSSLSTDTISSSYNDLATPKSVPSSSSVLKHYQNNSVSLSDSFSNIPSRVTPTVAILKPVSNPFETSTKFPLVSLPSLPKPLPTLPFSTSKPIPDISEISLPSFKPLPNPFEIHHQTPMTNKAHILSSFNGNIPGISDLSKQEQKSSLNNILSTSSTAPTMKIVAQPSTSEFSTATLTPSLISPPIMPFSPPSLTPLLDPPVVSLPPYKPVPNVFNFPDNSFKPTSTNTPLFSESDEPVFKPTSRAASKTDSSLSFRPLPNLFELPHPISTPTILSTVSSPITIPQQKSDPLKDVGKTLIKASIPLSTTVSPNSFSLPHLSSSLDLPVVSLPSFKPVTNIFNLPDPILPQISTHSSLSSESDIPILRSTSLESSRTNDNGFTLPDLKPFPNLFEVSHPISTPTITDTVSSLKTNLSDMKSELDHLKDAVEMPMEVTVPSPITPSPSLDPSVVSFPTLRPISDIFNLPHPTFLITSTDNQLSLRSDIPVLKPTSLAASRTDSLLALKNLPVSSANTNLSVTKSQSDPLKDKDETLIKASMPISTTVSPNSFSLPSLTPSLDPPAVFSPDLKPVPNIFNLPNPIFASTATHTLLSSESDIPVLEPTFLSASKTGPLFAFKPLPNLFELPHHISTPTKTGTVSSPNTNLSVTKSQSDPLKNKDEMLIKSSVPVSTKVSANQFSLPSLIPSLYPPVVPFPASKPVSDIFNLPSTNSLLSSGSDMPVFKYKSPPTAKTDSNGLTLPVFESLPNLFELPQPSFTPFMIGTVSSPNTNLSASESKADPLKNEAKSPINASISSYTTVSPNPSELSTDISHSYYTPSSKDHPVISAQPPTPSPGSSITNPLSAESLLNPFGLPNSLLLSEPNNDYLSTTSAESGDVKKSKSLSASISTMPFNSSTAVLKPLANPFDISSQFHGVSSTPLPKPLPVLPLPAFKPLADLPAISLPAFNPLPNLFELPNNSSTPTSTNSMT